MKILILCPNFTPIETARAFRWQAIVSYLAKDHEVSIVCANASSALSNEVKGNLHIYRRGYNNLMDVVYHFLNISARRDRPNTFSTTSKSNSKLSLPLIKFIKRLNQLFWHGLYWPDGSWIWYFPALRMAKRLLKKQQFDLIISVSLPFTAHLVGLKVKETYPEIPWLVDIGDPFSFHELAPRNNTKLYNKLNYRMEKKVLSKADGISLTVASALTAYQAHFPMISHKTKIISPVFIPPSNVAQSTIQFNQQKINLCYFGSFYQNIRTPSGFLALLTAVKKQDASFLEDIVIHFFGHIEPEIKQIFDAFPALHAYINIHGLQAKTTLPSLIEQADVLINISNQTSFQIPSKIGEYVYSKKPIINISPIENDAFAAALQEHPLLLHLHISDQSISKEQINQFIRFVKEHQNSLLAQNQMEQLFASFSIQHVANAYLEMLSYQ